MVWVDPLQEEASPPSTGAAATCRQNTGITVLFGLLIVNHRQVCGIRIKNKTFLKLRCDGRAAGSCPRTAGSAADVLWSKSQPAGLFKPQCSKVRNADATFDQTAV